MELEELVQLALDVSNGYVSFPFNDPKKKDKVVWHVIKHHHNDKMYGAIFEQDGQLQVNVKLTIEHGQELRQLAGIIPGYHMNKDHWNTISVNATELTETELRGVLRESAHLTE